MQEKKQEIYKIHCFYMGKINKNDNLIIKDLMSSYKSRDLGFYNISNCCFKVQSLVPLPASISCFSLCQALLIALFASLVLLDIYLLSNS